MFNNAGASAQDAPSIMPPRPQSELPRFTVAASSSALMSTPMSTPQATPHPASAASPSLPFSLTLRVDTPCAVRTRCCLRDALGNAIQIDDIATDCRGGRSTLVLHTDPGHLDLLMHTVMTCLPEAEFGPIGTMNVRVH